MTIQSRYRSAMMALVFVAGAGIQPVLAQELSPEQLKASKMALAASKATDRFDNILPTIAEKLKSDIIASRPDLADKVSAIVDEETLKLAVRRGDLENESATIYGRSFTMDELKQITDFYNSSAGKKLIKEAPILTRSLNEASKIWARGIVRDLNQAVAARMKEKGLN